MNRIEEQNDIKIVDPISGVELPNSSNLLLLQWPFNQLPDFQGKEMFLDLVDEGLMGNLNDSAGKSFELRCNEQSVDAFVLVSSSLETKRGGRIAKKVSLVHYSDPLILEEQKGKKQCKRQADNRQSSSSRNSTQRSTITQSSRLRNSTSSKGYSSKDQSRTTKSSSSFPLSQMSQ